MVIHQNNLSPTIGNPSQTAVRTTGDTAAKNSVTTRADNATSEDAQQRRLEAIAKREEELPDVVARSQDGDTLQIEEKEADIMDEDIGGVDSLNEEIVNSSAQEEDRKASFETEENAVSEITEKTKPKEEPEGAEAVLEEQIKSTEVETTAEKIAKEDAERFDDASAPSNFAGVSDMSLEQMYRDGIISRIDYETEINSRKDAKAQMAADEEKFSEEINAYDSEETRMERMGEAIETATSDRTANQDFSVSADERLEAIENLNRTDNESIEQQSREEENNRVWQYQQSLA